MTDFYTEGIHLVQDSAYYHPDLLSLLLLLLVVFVCIPLVSALEQTHRASRDFSAG